MRKYSLSALVAAGLLAGAATSASAADLGGNCCADLEERIAELEATAARKGNRKVSLTISGWVGEQITFWDDKHERNIYVTGLGHTLSSHFRFAGSAKINSDHSAGYVLHIEASTVSPLLGVNQNKDDGNALAAMSILESYWYLKSNSMGQVSVGQRSPATDNLAILTDGSGSLVQANWVLFENNGFFLRNGSAAGSSQSTFAWSNGLHCYTSGLGIGGDCTAAPMNIVRYDSPTFAGFSMSASWGEDDFWDVAGRYAGEFSGFKLAFAAGYSQATDFGVNNHQKVEQIQVGGYIQHVPTGLFVHGAWLREDVSRSGNATIDGLSPEMWYVKGGLRQRFMPFGHTVLYGEYAQGTDKMDPTFVAAGVTGSQVNWWGLGVVQEIDAAAMSVWIKYRNVDGDFTTAAGATANATMGWAAGKNSVDNMQMITVGGMISF